MKTAIRNGVVIAWKDDRHQVLSPGVVVFEDNEIVCVAERYDGAVDTTIDAAGRLVIPGLVNTHLHVTDTPYTKGFLEDFPGRPASPSIGVILRSEDPMEE